MSFVLLVAVITSCARAQYAGDSARGAYYQVSRSNGPSVYQSVSSKVSALEARLAEVELENKHVLAKQQAVYDAELKARQDSNAQTTAQNAKIEQEITKLRTETHDLEGEARNLEKENGQFLNDLNVMKANLSTVLEYTDGSLKDLATDNAAELSVLDELAKAEAHQTAKASHSMRLQEIATVDRFGGMALLQASVMKSPSPETLLKVLDAGFTDLSEEHSQRKAELKAQYTKLFQKEVNKHSQLMATQKDLNATRKSLTTLSEQLVTAVKFLREQRKELEKRSRSIRSYAQRLGIRALPAQQYSEELRAASAPLLKPASSSKSVTATEHSFSRRDDAAHNEEEEEEEEMQPDHARAIDALGSDSRRPALRPARTPPLAGTPAASVPKGEAARRSLISWLRR